jgi:sialate O-acetylesterase
MKRHLHLLASLTLLCSLPAKASLRLPAIFSDHMVLQRDTAVPVWGWADAGEQVTVSIAGEEKTAVADATGKWMVTLDHLTASQTMVVQGKNTVVIQDVLVGEVWLGSGQSNMDFPLGWQGAENIAAVATVNDPELRYFDVPHKGSLQPESDVVGHWQVATPANAKNWSAIGAYFGQNLRAKLGVPVAFIKSSYGGTPIAPWISRPALNQDPAWKANADQEIAAMVDLPGALQAFPGKMEAWMAANGAADPGNAGLADGWANPSFDDTDWKDIEVPSQVAKAGLKAGGILWYRKSFTLLPAAAAKDFDFDLGWVNDGAVTVYFNGAELKPVAPSPYVKF